MIIHIVQLDSATRNDQITYYDLEMSRKDRVGSIKTRILNERQHIVTEITFNGEGVDDNMSLEECKIENGSTVYIKSVKLVRGGGATSARIVVKTDNGDSLIQRKLHPTTSVEDLKNSIVDEVDTSAQQIQFVLNGQVIPNEALVGDLGIRRREMMYYLINLEPMFSPEGRKIGYVLKPARS